MGTISVYFINNAGQGFADWINIAEGKTVGQFFGEKLPGENPNKYCIRVNRNPVNSDYVLRNQDHVSFTMQHAKGAH